MRDLLLCIKNYNSGLREYKNNNFYRALKFFDKSVYYRFEYIPAILMKAMCFFKMRNFEQAADQATSALMYEPDSIDAQFLKALCDYKNENFDMAFETIKKALKIRPSDSHINALCGLIYSGIKQDEKAVQYFQKAAQLEPTPFFLFNKAKSLIKTGNISRAIQILDKIENYPAADFWLAKSLLLKNRDKAEKIFIRLLKEKKYRIQSMYYLSEIYLTKRLFKNAAGLLAKLVLHFPNNLVFCYKCATAFYLAGYYNYSMDFLNYADKLSGTKKRDIEFQARILKLKIRVLFKLKNQREKLLIPLKRLEYLSRSRDYSFFIEKSYIKLYKKYSNKSDYKTALYMRQEKGKSLTGTIYSDYSGKIRKWVLISVIFLLVIFILWEILVFFQN